VIVWDRLNQPGLLRTLHGSASMLSLGPIIKGRGIMDMNQSGVVLSRNEIRDLVFRLPPVEIVQLADEIEDRAMTLEMMFLAEKGFAEWREPGEDIYDTSGETR